jgi:hypothetical protein
MLHETIAQISCREWYPPQPQSQSLPFLTTKSGWRRFLRSSELAEIKFMLATSTPLEPPALMLVV